MPGTRRIGAHTLTSEGVGTDERSSGLSGVEKNAMLKSISSSISSDPLLRSCRRAPTKSTTSTKVEEHCGHVIGGGEGTGNIREHSWQSSSFWRAGVRRDTSIEAGLDTARRVEGGARCP